MTDRNDDIFAPPTDPVLCHCLRCGGEYLSSQIMWQLQPDLPDGGYWGCPTEDCGGMGFGFDILPADPIDSVDDDVWDDYLAADEAADELADELADESVEGDADADVECDLYDEFHDADEADDAIGWDPRSVDVFENGLWLDGRGQTPRRVGNTPHPMIERMIEARKLKDPPFLPPGSFKGDEFDDKDVPF